MNKEFITPCTLDFGKLGNQAKGLSEQINFPYVYLPNFLREDMSSVAKRYVQPLLQDLSRAGKQPVLMKEQVAEEKERLSPDRLTIRDYIFQCKRAYEGRLNLYYQISLLMGEYMDGKLSDIQLVTEGWELLRRQSEIDPTMFALAALARVYMEKYIGMIPTRFLSEEELDLIVTTAVPPAYVSFELDMREYLASSDDEKQVLKPGLIKRYFNGEELYFTRKVVEMEQKTEQSLSSPEKKQEILDKIHDVRDAFKSRWVRKVDLLAERKIPYAAELDEIMMMDNCFDKYLRFKSLFLHDLFLRIAIMDIVSHRRVLELTPENLSAKVREALFISDEDLGERIRKYVGSSTAQLFSKS